MMNITKDKMHELIDLETYNPNEVMIYENKKSCCCIFFCRWFFQIMVLLSFFLFIIILIITKNPESFIIFCIFILFYIFYIIINLCSESAKFLKEINLNEGLEKILNDLFSQAPKINICVHCYHEESDSNRTYNVTTYLENFNFLNIILGKMFQVFLN